MIVKALNLKNKTLTTECMIHAAKDIPGAWTGLKIAALILLQNGYKPTEIGSLFGLSRQTMTRWVHQANERGLESLEKTPPPGRPSRLTDEVRELLETDMREDPRVYGLPRGGWNPAKLQMHLQRKYGIKVKNRQARNYFNELQPAGRNILEKMFG